MAFLRGQSQPASNYVVQKSRLFHAQRLHGIVSFNRPFNHNTNLFV